MLTRIKLTNFKSWRELDIELAPLTLLFGTNSSGKSSVLQALLLLKQTVNSLDRKQPINFGGNARDYVDFGSYRDLVFGHDETASVGVGLEWVEWDEWEWSDSNIGDLTRLWYHTNWRRYQDAVQIENLGYDQLGERTMPSVFAKRKDKSNYDYVFSEGWQPSLSQLQLSLFQDDSPMENRLTSIPPESCYILPSQRLDHQRESQSLRGFDINIYNTLFESLINRLAYLGPLRQYPQRSYIWTGAAPNIIEPDGENTISAILASQRKGESLLINVSEWLEKMGLVDEFTVEALDSNKRFYETKVKIGEAESSLLDIGFGVSQVLPVITLLFFAPEGSIILLEQPELHLHPRAQAHLADLFLHVAEKRKLQLIVESHSEHLLRRLQRRVAETEHPFANPENLKMYFCQPGENGSEIQPVDIDKYGQIKNWPEDFFGDILGDLDAMTDAALEERRRELEGG